MELTRREGERAPVTHVELFFDLVYVFAITQLSHRLITDPSAGSVAQTVLLFAMVWTAWVYTTWVTNWLDPERLPVRGLLLGLVPASIVLSSSLPGAFAGAGLGVGAAYAVMQVGRSLFAVWALRGDVLLANFQRILAWCVVSGAFAVAGGVAHGGARTALWVAAVLTDLLGGQVGFWTPKLGRSSTEDWQIEGGHFAERCQAFLLIALGESIVSIGSTLTGLSHVAVPVVLAFVEAVGGVAVLWWLYFDQSAEDGERAVTDADDPGALGRNAFHLLHPVMVFGVVLNAAADEHVLQHPAQHPSSATTFALLGGTVLFLVGHAAYLALVRHETPVSRLVGAAAVLCLVPVAPHVSAAVLGLLVLALGLAVVGVDAARGPQHDAVAAAASEDGDEEQSGHTPVTQGA